MVGAARIQRTAVALMASAPAKATTLVPLRRPVTARERRMVLLPTTGTPTSALPIVIVEAAAKDITREPRVKPVRWILVRS
mmetsp:Transcript_9478/g.35254  ORF Transcript_9478/g.35254 Transcript_9478/m.35254 type:complete len:81 (-) Transcript_9478:79-321(-)